LCSCTIALLLVPSHFWHSSGSNLVAHSLVIDGCSQPGVRWLCVRTGTLASLPALVGSATFPVGLPCFLPIPMWGPYGVGMAATVPTWDVAPWMVCLLLHLFTCRGRVGSNRMWRCRSAHGNEGIGRSFGYHRDYANQLPPL
jgi:hypothetical protein